MFQIGLFTTHLPYVLIIAFYVAAFLFKPVHKEATISDDKTIRKHSCIVSCNKDSLYFKEVTHQFHKKNIHCCWKAMACIPDRQTASSSLIPWELNFTPNYSEELTHIFLSKNIPNRAPPAGVLLKIV